MQDENGDGGALDIQVEEFVSETQGFFAQLGDYADQAGNWLNENGPEWAIGIAVVIGLYFLFRIIRATISGVLKSSSQPPNSVRNVAAALVSGTNSLLLLLGAAVLVAPFVFNLSETGLTYLQRAFMVFLILQLALWVRVVVKALLHRVAERNAGDESTLANAVGLLTVFANVLIFALALMMILGTFDIDIAPLIAGLGVGGIAIGLAAQNIFKDLFASLSIVLDKPFAKQDFIQFGPNSLGTVQKIGMKTTRIQSLSGEQLVVGNSQLLDQEIRNYRRMTERRIVFEVGVTYQTPHGELKAIPGYIREIIEGMDMTRFDRSHMKEFADSAIAFETVYYVLSRDYNVYMDVNQEILLAIHRVFERQGIEIAYPTRTLWVAGDDPERATEPASQPEDRPGDTAMMSRR